MLPFLSNLYYFSFTDLKYKTSPILSELSKSELRILSIPEFRYGTSILKEMSITSLTISYCHWNELFEVFQYTLALKYLKIEHLGNYLYGSDPPKLSTGNAVRLKLLISNDCIADFELIEQWFKSIPNLTIFTTQVDAYMNMINTERWQHLIESSLLHLRVFNFYFNHSICTHSYNDMLNKFPV